MASTLPKKPAEQSSAPAALLLQPSLEELTRRTKELRPDHFAGALLKLLRPFSSHFQLSHSLFLPENPSDGYYTYGATYFGDIINETDANPILNGEISPSGIFSGVIVHKLSKNTVARCNASFSQGKWLASQLCLDHQTPNSALSLALDKFNPISMSGLMVAQFMRRISDSLSLGFDYQAMRRDQDNFLARCGLVGLVKYRDSQLLLSVANKMPYFSASLTQKIKVDPAYELRCFLDAEICQKETVMLDGPPQQARESKLEVTGSVGYNFRIPLTGFTFKSAAKSDGSFVSNAEYRLQGLPLTFGISALLNHKADRFSTGFKVVFGQ